MDCLEDIVGVRGLCGGDTVPNSVYYLNDLAGIGIKEADAAMDSESSSAYDFLVGKINLAGDIIGNDIRTHFNPRFRGASVMEMHTVGAFTQNLQVAPSQATYLIGKNLYLYNSYLELHISKIGLHVANTGNVSVFVYDLTSNKLLDTFTVATVSGEVSYLDVSKSYKAQGQMLNLFIGYAATFDRYKTNITANGCTSCKRSDECSNPYIHASSSKILSASNKVDENLESNSNNDGLSITYSLNCSFEPFVCSVKHMLAQAIWYKAGALVAQEMQYSKRFNSVINLRKNDAAELYTMYEGMYKDSMSTILQNMRMPDNLCFDCNKQVRLKVNLP